MQQRNWMRTPYLCQNWIGGLRAFSAIAISLAVLASNSFLSSSAHATELYEPGTVIVRTDGAQVRLEDFAWTFDRDEIEKLIILERDRAICEKHLAACEKEQGVPPPGSFWKGKTGRSIIVGGMVLGFSGAFLAGALLAK